MMIRRLVKTRCMGLTACLALAAACSTSQPDESVDLAPRPLPAPIVAPETPAEWQFVVDHAPEIWLAEGEPYFPSSVNYFLENTRPVTIDGRLWAVTKDELPSPSSILPFFRGVQPGDAAWPPPIYAFVLPGPGQPGIESIENPGSSTLRVVYFVFYPYNRGKEVINTVWGNHVGDIEKCYVEFVDTEPVLLNCAVHSWDNAQQWGDVNTNDGHPIVYSAWGSHGTYFTPGAHRYSGVLEDETSAGTKWETWRNVQLVFPDDWHRMRLPIDGWEDIAFFNDIHRWGNPEDGACPPLVGECQLNDGPGGFLGKSELRGIISELDRDGAGAGWTTCSGNEASEDCPWPAGIWSSRENSH